MLTRLAVTTVLVCTLILLASACGWGGGYNGPSIQPQEFVLYQTAPGDPPRIIGDGEISSTGPFATARVNFFEMPCLNGSLGELSEEIGPNTTSVDLHSNPALPATVTLAGEVFPLSRGYLTARLPFVGTLKPNDPCAGNLPIHLEARPGPDLRHSWHGKLPGSTGHRASVYVSLYQVRPHGRSLGALWGDVSLDQSNCGIFGRFSAIGDASAIPRDGAKFRLNGGYILTVTGLPSTLDPDPPSAIPITLTFTGGPCNAQTFTSTLTH